MQGSHRDKKSFPLTLGNEEGHEGAEVDPRLLEFPPLDACREPLFRRRLEGGKEEEKICVTAQQMNTSIPSTPYCLQIYSPGDLYSGFIELHARLLQLTWNANWPRAPWKDRNKDGLEWEFWDKSIFYSKIGGVCLHRNLGRCIGSPKLREACVSVECRPNFQHRPHHLLCQEPSYTMCSLMRVP